MSEEWPEAISDGLTLPCGLCGKIPLFDYRVEDSIWNELAPISHKLGVICLPCLDQIAYNRGITIGNHILELQYTGLGHTVVLCPTFVHVYKFPT